MSTVIVFSTDFHLRFNIHLIFFDFIQYLFK